MDPIALGIVALLFLTAGKGGGSGGGGGESLASLNLNNWENRQVALRVLGYDPGRIDGGFGPNTRAALQQFQSRAGVSPSGVWDSATHAAMSRALSSHTIDDGGFPWGQYKPYSSNQTALFEEAARRSGLPVSWGSSDSLAEIIQRESKGWVGIPNYTYGHPFKDVGVSNWPRIWSELHHGEFTAQGAYSKIMGKSIRSSATGLGQLLASNADVYYPSARFGIGVPIEEAIGMLRYIKRRYGSPDRALNCYKVLCPSPPCPTVYGSAPCDIKKGFKEGY
jgi:hypothetical protein